MILQDPTRPGRVLEALGELLGDPSAERLRVAVAYANVGAVRALHRLLEANDHITEVEVVVTLDMGITRKTALDALLNEFPGAAKAIETGGVPGTFHTKAFLVDRGGAAPRALVGSANLTHAALTTNYEAVSMHDLTPQEAATWEAWWTALWQAADDVTEQMIAGYTERKPPPRRRERIADEDVETTIDGSTITHTRPDLDAAGAAWLAIDWSGTGEYKVQYEFPKVPAAFLHPQRSKSRPVMIEHDGTEYDDNQLTYYPHNGMARVNLDNDIPVVADGSIKQQTSLFTRIGDDRYELTLLSPAERGRRLAEASLTGGTAHTRYKDGTLREFGWA
jgi:HKD family nuclease